MKKFVAEGVGTFFLVLFSCGAAIFAGSSLGPLGVAFAFGLSFIAMAFIIGKISGCHINPAVSLGFLLTDRIQLPAFFGYVLAQFLGGILAGGVLMFFVVNSSIEYMANTTFATNGYGAASGANLSVFAALAVELLLTFVFVLTVLNVTEKDRTPSFSGIVIGLALTLVHIVGIPLTGTSVNPARSFGVAIFKGGDALLQVWLFIVAPLAGAALAALVYRYYLNRKAGASINESDLS